MKKVAIYIRRSKEGDNQRSIKEQTLLGTEFCDNNGFIPVIYNDGVISGTDKENKVRPEYERMLKDIKKKTFYGVYLWNTDRSARNEISWQRFATLLKENNVYLFDNGNKVDFNDDNSYLFYTIKSGMDAHFARVTSSKIKAVLARNAKEGNFNGILKYGYTKDDNGKIIIDKEEAKVVKKVFQLCIAGNGYKAISDYLNDNNIPTRYNKIGGNYNHIKDTYVNKNRTQSKANSKWTSAVVGKMLRSRNYIGERTFNEEVYKIPKIVSHSIFQKAQEIIDSRKNKSGKRTKYKYLLNNILRCANCGKRYTAKKVNNFTYYRCASGIKKGGACGSSGVKTIELESFVWDYFTNDDKLLKVIQNQAINNKKDNKKPILEKELKAANKKLKGLEQELFNTNKFLLKGLILEDEAKKQLKRIRSEINDTNVQTERLKESLDKLNNAEADFENIVSELKSLKENMTFSEKQEIIEQHLDVITIIKIDALFVIEMKFKSLTDKQIFIVEGEAKIYNPSTSNGNVIDSSHHKTVITSLTN